MGTLKGVSEKGLFHLPGVKAFRDPQPRLKEAFLLSQASGKGLANPYRLRSSCWRNTLVADSLPSLPHYPLPLGPTPCL